ncbi:basic secretory protein-like protein [Dysosmobacter welbionis]|uniref:basic secretory protein-like protein n=1 Tax=Dysosmobacter welbionis TaxID=2093857 RepID=UPI003AB1FF3D
MKVNILGTEYTVSVTNEGNEPRLNNMDGFCDETSKEIVAENYQTKIDSDSKKNLLLQTKKVLRHEIVHAFLFESGLAENSEWAQNEEMVDWIAMQGPKLMKAWQEAGAL